MQITFRPRFFSRVATSLLSFRRDIQNGEYWSEVIPFIGVELEKVFQSEGYGSWPDLSSEYAAWKEKNYPGQTMLRLTDQYYQAATEPNSENNIIEIQNNRLRYSVQGVEYAVYHEEGRGDLPQRPVFNLLSDSDRFNQQLTDIVNSWILERINIFNRG